MIMAHILNCILFVFICCISIVNGVIIAPVPTTGGGFTATLSSGPNSYAKDAIIQYNRILCPNSNYNAGKYTVTVAGNYLVSVTMMSGTVTAHTTLMKNTAIYVWLYTGNQYDMATQTVYMQLAVGEMIWVKMTNKASILFDVYNTFTVVQVS
ncbi:Hypothetical predicted protein [Mytilus galloprovincialis]|uniref:C1q domain-containing protein n=2 Tax=Mytilus galloprovincialis TaxID=29158 RepID=A0A8B6EVN1_MYTGA|nr:Hypothetical predicted protein [Mytilus galloprovincialis]